MIDVLKPLIKQFMPFAQQKMGFSRPPRLFLRQDAQNAANPMGKTGFYDAESEAITLYISGRHPKDIMRSLAHELMHHTQNCNGEFEKTTSMGEEGYAQNDPHMRTMEIQAYQASIVFRDWEDSCKGTIYYEHLQKGDKSSMSTKNWKNQELKSLLTEKWGFKMDLSKLNEAEGEKGKYDGPDSKHDAGVDKDADGIPDGGDPNPNDPDNPDAENAENKKDLDEGGASAEAPAHYCVHHGGVQREGKIEMAEAVNHNYDEELGRVTHYDMKFEDGTIMENVAFEDIQVTNATLAEKHNKHKAKKRKKVK
jgi:hypothetical protein